MSFEEIGNTKKMSILSRTGIETLILALLPFMLVAVVYLPGNYADKQNDKMQRAMMNDAGIKFFSVATQSIYRVNDYSQFRSDLASGVYSVNDLVYVLNPAGPAFRVEIKGSNVDNGGTIITGGSFAGVRPCTVIDLIWFGAIPGTDTANASNNADALERAVAAVASGANTLKGGAVDLGHHEWVFGEVTLNLKWGWSIVGHNQKTYHTGPFNLEGCAGFSIRDIFPISTEDKTFDGFVFRKSSPTGERLHNFVFSNVSPSGFDNAIHAVEDTSQCWIIGGQFAGNNKSIYFEGGFTSDHIYFINNIFASHAPASTAFDVRSNNWRLVNPHFETVHYDDSTIDLYASGQQYAIVGGEMFFSGGIYMTGNSGFCKDLIIQSCSNTIAIQTTAGLESSVSGNFIRWSTNSGLGTVGSSTRASDGLGKIGIKGTGWVDCSKNYIKRCSVGIELTGDNVELEGNSVIEPADIGIDLIASDNVKVRGGKIVLKDSSAIGVRHSGASNGTDTEINDITWYITAGEKYDFTGPHVRVNESGLGDPEGQLYGGPGSTYRRTNGGSGSSFYVKETTATSNTGWRAF